MSPKEIDNDVWIACGKRPNSWPAKSSYTALCSKKQEAACVNLTSHQCFWYFTVGTSPRQCAVTPHYM